MVNGNESITRVLTTILKVRQAWSLNEFAHGAQNFSQQCDLGNFR